MMSICNFLKNYVHWVSTADSFCNTKLFINATHENFDNYTRFHARYRIFNYIFIRCHSRNMQDILHGTCPSLEQQSPQEESC